MQKQLLKGFAPLAASVLLLAAAPAMPPWMSGCSVAVAAQVDMQKNVYAGKVVGLSKKAKTISIEVGPEGNAKVMMVKYDEATTGLEHAATDHGAVIDFKTVGAERIATVIKPKLVKLPLGTVEMQVADLAMLIAKGDVDSYFLVDARPAKPFAQGSIPTAVSIPVDKMKAEGARLLPADKDRMLVFFCGGVTCGMSVKDAEMAVKLGYTNVHVMLQGVPGWKKAGNSLVASQNYLESGNIVLVDLRSPAEYEAGHIARAHNIPLAQLEGAGDDLPASPAAPIVLYGNGDQAENGYRTLAKLQRQKIALSPMDYKAWQKAGKQVAVGPTPEEIVWVRELGKDEVGVEEFMQVATAQVDDKLILDVRNDDEAAAGSFFHAVHIPLDQLAAKMDTLPKGKEILIHCTTGIRAEMACNELHNAGFKSRYLVAKVACAGAACEVE